MMINEFLSLHCLLRIDADDDFCRQAHCKSSKDFMISSLKKLKIAGQTNMPLLIKPAGTHQLSVHQFNWCVCILKLTTCTFDQYRERLCFSVLMHLHSGKFVGVDGYGPVSYHSHHIPLSKDYIFMGELGQAKQC